MNPRLQAIADRLGRIELTPRQRKLATYAGYPIFALFVALLAFYWSVPRVRVKDRLETALSADVMSGQPLAIGMDVQIGELTMKMFTGLGFRAKDIVLRTRPLTPGEKPARYIIDDVRVRLGLFSTLFGRPSYSFLAHALSGSVDGHVSGNSDGSKVDVDIEKLVLNGVPGIQQSFGGLPVDGTVSGKLDVTVPKNLIANANGTIDVDIEDISIGDGKAKLTVPGDPFLAAGLTVPRIRLGKLSGQIVIDKGKARFEGVRLHSADGDASLDGYLELHDPIGMSQMHAYLKFRPSEALLKREPTLELLVNSMAGTAKRSDGYLGIQMTGPLTSMFFLPSKDPPFGVTTSNEPSVSATPTPPMPSPRLPTPPVVSQPVVAPPPPPPPVAQPEPQPSTPPSGAAAPSGASPSGASPSGGFAAPSPATPPPGGGTEVAPPPSGVPPPPALRTLRAEPSEATPPPAKNE